MSVAGIVPMEDGLRPRPSAFRQVFRSRFARAAWPQAEPRHVAPVVTGDQRSMGVIVVASAGKPKGTSEEGKVSKADKHNTASKGMAETTRGAGGTGDPEAPDDVDYVRPVGEGDVELGGSHGEHKAFRDRSDT